jgi:4'-phosphopantetheinyl transferase EntD
VDEDRRNKSRASHTADAPHRAEDRTPRTTQPADRSCPSGSVIEEILPSSVASAEAFGDRDDALVFPEEEALLADAPDRRRRSFATARACARRALADLGVPPVAIPRGERGAPQWPPGVVGSITHCEGYRASAVAWSRDVVGIGIDAEPNEPVPPRVLTRIASREELDHVRELAATDTDASWDRLVFSAKESTYKAWFPLTRRWLGFQDAAVTVEAATATFRVRLKVPGPLVAGSRVTEFAGRWLVARGLVVTAIAIPRARHPDVGGSAAE